MALTRYVSSEIWEVKADDPGTFVGLSLLLMAIAVLAGVIPIRRAIRVDPTIALRYE
jgi:putative ABC transport system permease protein